MKCKFREGGSAYVEVWKDPRPITLHVASEIRGDVDLRIQLTPYQAKMLGERLVRVSGK